MSTHKRPPLVDEACLMGAGIPGVCDRCEAELPKGRRRWCSDECSAHYYRHHIWQYARNAALKRDKNRCVNGCPPPYGVSLEVDHIRAAKGAHSKHACVHHLDNLRTLCRPCHVARTAEQRASGPTPGIAGPA